jgi:hypothetical protein
MLKRNAAIIGLVIFLFTVAAGIALFVMQRQARAIDHEETGFGVIAGDFLPCVWEVDLSQRVLTENKSHTIVVNATNGMDEKCQSSLTLLAPGFDISPRKDEQVISAEANDRGSVAWVVASDKAGEYEIAITDGVDTRVLGVTVTNLFGLTAVQLQVLAVIGAILGPMLSVPWWLERIQRKKAKPAAPAATAS